MSWTDMIPGSGIVKGIAGVANNYMEGKQKKQKAKAEKAMAELDLEREIVRQSTGWCRIFALAFLFGPDAALLLPWITAGDLQAYYEALSQAQPEWRATAKEYIVLAMWGGAEATNLGHSVQRKREKAKEKEKEQSEDTSHRPTDRSDHL